MLFKKLFTVIVLEENPIHILPVAGKTIKSDHNSLNNAFISKG